MSWNNVSDYVSDKIKTGLENLAHNFSFMLPQKRLDFFCDRLSGLNADLFYAMADNIIENGELRKMPTIKELKKLYREYDYKINGTKASSAKEYPCDRCLGDGWLQVEYEHNGYLYQNEMRCYCKNGERFDALPLIMTGKVNKLRDREKIPVVIREIEKPRGHATTSEKKEVVEFCPF
jgi:hypothetical protein